MSPSNLALLDEFDFTNVLTSTQMLCYIDHIPPPKYTLLCVFDELIRETLNHIVKTFDADKNKNTHLHHRIKKAQHPTRHCLWSYLLNSHFQHPGLLFHFISFLLCAPVFFSHPDFPAPFLSSSHATTLRKRSFRVLEMSSTVKFTLLTRVM